VSRAPRDGRRRSRGAPDEGLRREALARLGPSEPELAREALEAGTLAVEPDVIAWEGSLGPVRAHRVTLLVAVELSAALEEHPSSVDALTRAIAAAVAATPGVALAALEIGASDGPPPRATPYRGRL
jgi:hypothetical protein